MDAFEYYLLFHKDSTQFFDAIVENNGEILIALERLIANNKIQYAYEKENCFAKVWQLIQCDVDGDEKLDAIFESLMQLDQLSRVDTVSFWTLEQLEKFNQLQHDRTKSMNLFRIVRVMVRVLQSSTEDSHIEYVKKLSQILLDILLMESAYTYLVVSILKHLVKDYCTRALILSEIYLRTNTRMDKHSLQNLCSFFDEICCGSVNIDMLQTLQRFFTSSADMLSRKQGVFVIKTLIHHGKFGTQDEESFKRLTIVVEALDENQSHLILPVLEVMSELDFSAQFDSFWFIAFRMVITHENNLVRNWGLNYLLREMKRKFNNAEITEILSALNCTPFFDPEDSQLNHGELRKFIDRNFVRAFHCLNDVNWIAVPFFRILEMIVSNLETMDTFDDHLLIDLNQQTDTIPKRIKNVTIRAGVQGLYSRIIRRLIKLDNYSFTSALFVQTCMRIMEIGKNRRLLADSLKLSGDRIYELIRDDLPEDLVAFVLSFMCESKKDIESLAKTLQNHERMLRLTMCLMNENHKGGKLQETMIDDKETFMSTDVFVMIPLEDLLHMKNFYINTKSDQEVLRKILDRLQALIDDCINEETIETILKILKGLCEKVFRHTLTQEIEQEFLDIFNKTFTFILRTDDRKVLIWRFLEILLITCEVRHTSILWNENIIKLIYSIFEQSSSMEKSLNFQVVLNFIDKSDIFHPIGVLRDLAKKLLIDRILETEMWTRDQQTESAVCSEIEKSQNFNTDNMTVQDRKRQRLRAALILAKLYGDELIDIVELYMEDFSKASRKKPRYFPNSWIHRWKMHCLQPILFCTKISERVLEILIYELLHVNNQLSVTYLIEIILAKHHPNIINLLSDETIVLNLKAPALKSIFVIAVMQRKREDSFTLLEENFLGIAEVKLKVLHDVLMPFTMGHNYAVRSYAQTAIIILYQHVRSIFGTRDTQRMQGLSNTCQTIQKSLIFKNAGKLFDILRYDFRFSLKFDQIWTIDIFYNHIPAVTRMSFEEIILPDEFDTDIGYFKKVDRRVVKIAEMEVSGECHVVSDEVEIPVAEQKSESSLNLQQKYLPIKYRVPTEKFKRELIPQVFYKDAESFAASVSFC